MIQEPEQSEHFLKEVMLLQINIIKDLELEKLLLSEDILETALKKLLFILVLEEI